MKYVYPEDPFNLHLIWDATLDIYREVAKICERHGLRHYLTDGTAIGVVRHKGFIPWDDDFDMSMPRGDYEKFIEYAKTELPSHLKFLNWKNCPEFNFMFGKVQDTRRDQVERIEKESGRNLSNGLYIDIFPIDGYPTSRLEIAWVKFMSPVYRLILRYKVTPFSMHSRKGKVGWLMGCLWSLAMPWLRTPTAILERCERNLLKHPFEGAKSTLRASLYLTGLNRRPIPSGWWGEPSRGEMNGLEVPLPHDYDSFLRFYFGDYMTPPDKSHCHPTHAFTYRNPWWLGPTK